MLTEHQKAKRTEWMKWRRINHASAPMPHGLAVIDLRNRNGAPFPTTEQMEPSRKDFGLEG